MRYVTRDGSGNVDGILKWPQHDGQERLEEDHPDVIAYRTIRPRRRARAGVEVESVAMLDAAVPKLERERAALLPDGNPEKALVLMEVERVQALRDKALAKIEAATTAEEIEAVEL